MVKKQALKKQDLESLYKKFLIIDIEERLNRVIRKNITVIGVDIAKKNTGICVIKTTNTYLHISYFDKIIVKMKGKEVHPCLDAFIEEFELFKARVFSKHKKFDVLIIEDCWLGKNVWTLKMLSKYEVLFYVGFKEYAVDIPDPRQARSARARVGFKKNKESKLDIKRQVQAWIQENFNLDIIDADHSDAFILALSGLTEKT